MVTLAKIRSLIEQLLDLYESDGEPLPVFADDAHVAPLAHGWYVAVRRLGLAVIHLVEGGYGFEAAPVRRSLLEHVVALRWLTRATDDAVSSLLRAHQRSTRRLREATREAHWSIADDGVFDVILGADRGTSSEDRNLHFRQRCEEYGTEDLYAAWLVESSTSHPSFSAANAYLNGEQDEQADGSLAVVAWALLVASDSFNHLIVDKPWTGDLTRIGDELVDLVKASGLR